MITKKIKKQSDIIEEVAKEGWFKSYSSRGFHLIMEHRDQLKGLEKYQEADNFAIGVIPYLVKAKHRLSELEQDLSKEEVLRLVTYTFFAELSDEEIEVLRKYPPRWDVSDYEIPALLAERHPAYNRLGMGLLDSWVQRDAGLAYLGMEEYENFRCQGAKNHQHWMDIICVHGGHRGENCSKAAESFFGSPERVAKIAEVTRQQGFAYMDRVINYLEGLDVDAEAVLMSQTNLDEFYKDLRNFRKFVGKETVPKKKLRMLENGKFFSDMFGAWKEEVQGRMEIVSQEPLALWVRAALNNKKSFLRLLKEQEEQLNLVNFRGYKALLSEELFYLVNFNQMDEKMLFQYDKANYRVAFQPKKVEEGVRKVLGEPMNFREVKESHIGRQLTPQEGLMYVEAPTWKRELMLHDSGIPFREKVEKMAAIPSVDGFSVNMEEFLPLLIEKLQDNSFIHFRQKYPQLSRQGAFVLYVYEDKWRKVVDEVLSDRDVSFLLENEVEGDLKEAKRSYYMESDEFRRFVEKLAFQEDFVSNNLDGLVRFAEEGEMERVMIFLSTNQSRETRDSMARIVKAVVTGKWNKLKYPAGDLERELSQPVSSEMEEAWKKSRMVDGDYVVQERDDFHITFGIGEYPVRSCQSYDDGQYSHCLLSNFDSNKKVAVVEKDGKPIARALLRLTKVSNKKKSGSKLEFVDVENEGKNDENVVRSGEDEVVVFVERLYNEHQSQNEFFKKKIVELAEKIGADLGVRVALSSGYKSVASNYESEEKYVYISKSKNGSSYLDSMGGERGATEQEQDIHMKLLLSQ